MFFKYISFPAFLISLAIGLLFVYITNDEPKIIYIYPTPDNSDKVLFKDKADNCYKFKANEISCPLLKLNVHKIPIQ
jgi:hypothetical protein